MKESLLCVAALVLRFSELADHVKECVLYSQSLNSARECQQQSIFGMFQLCLKFDVSVFVRKILSLNFVKMSGLHQPRRIDPFC